MSHSDTPQLYKSRALIDEPSNSRKTAQRAPLVEKFILFNNNAFFLALAMDQIVQMAVIRAVITRAVLSLKWRSRLSEK